MFDILTLKKTIAQVYKQEQKKHKGFKLAICDDIVNEVEALEPEIIYFNEKKRIVGYRKGSLNIKTKCHPDDEFDKYVGASIVLGIAHFGGKGSFIKALGGVDYREYPSMALANAYNRYGSKEAFENAVDELISNSRQKRAE